MWQRVLGLLFLGAVTLEAGLADRFRRQEPHQIGFFWLDKPSNEIGARNHLICIIMYS